METEVELQDSSQPETEEETSEEQEDELVSKNRQLFERAKKAEAKAKELEAKMAELETRADETDDYQEEDKLLKEVKSLKSELDSIKQKNELDAVINTFPMLGEKLDEFDSYRDENPGMSMQVAAKAFLVERDLLGEKPKRKGLEPARGGKKTPPSPSSMSVEDVKRLRENNFREYSKLLAEGKITIADE